MQLRTNPEASGAESVSERVIGTVATEVGVPPTELTPLYDRIDPDALDSLSNCESVERVEFTYHGRRVVVHGDGRIAVEGDRD